MSLARSSVPLLLGLPMSSRSLLLGHDSRRNGGSERYSPSGRYNVAKHPIRVHKRYFIGLGEILGVLTNPAETVRSLTESRKLLEDARQEIKETKERAQLRPTHTFSPLPTFFPRPAERRALEHILAGPPTFTILFGASSVGKTALLREVLSDNERYHVLHFDLRIAGFADLGGLYESLAVQMEAYFEKVGQMMEGYEVFEKEAWAFKHDRLDVQRRIENSGPPVQTSDIARLMELFQSSLLRYWQFEPKLPDDEGQITVNSEETKVPSSYDSRVRKEDGGNSRQGIAHGHGHRKRDPRSHDRGPPGEKEKKVEGKGKERPQKKIPVVFFDEAHKLPTLINSPRTMQTLLNAMLVLTKQDRLCHIIHATSDAFYQTWLRQPELDVMQHCRVVTVGDCVEGEMRRFWEGRVVPGLGGLGKGEGEGLVFERLWGAFGGRMVHWEDYVAEYVNSNGTLPSKDFITLLRSLVEKKIHLHPVEQSSHFLQAYTLLNLHIIHASESESQNQRDQQEKDREQDKDKDTPTATRNRRGFGVYASREVDLESYVDASDRDRDRDRGYRVSSSSTVHPLRTIHRTGIPTSQSQSQLHIQSQSQTSTPSPSNTSFTAIQLLRIMSKLVEPGVSSLPYFLLCREIGTQAVDDLVRGRVLELRWTEVVRPEHEGGDGDGEGGREVDLGEEVERGRAHGLAVAGSLVGAGGYESESGSGSGSGGSETELELDLDLEADPDPDPDHRNGEQRASEDANDRLRLGLNPSSSFASLSRSSTMRHHRVGGTGVGVGVGVSVPTRPPRTTRPGLGHRRGGSGATTNTNTTLDSIPISVSSRVPATPPGPNLNPNPNPGAGQGRVNPGSNAGMNASTAVLRTSHGVSVGSSAPGNGGSGVGVGGTVRGPMLLPITPIMRYAMREVLKEYRLPPNDTNPNPNTNTRNNGNGNGNGDSHNVGYGRGAMAMEELERASSYTSVSDVEEY